MAHEHIASWTDDRVDILKELHKDGLSCSQIAKQLGGGVSRNGVIGKLHRLGLSGRPAPSKPSRIKAAVDPKGSNSSRRLAALVAGQAYAPPSEPCSRAAGLTQLVDLKPQHCRWPIGDPVSGPFGFCGCARIETGPYCRAHNLQAHDQAANARVKKSGDLARSLRRHA
jgi:GcrA cell cycle regulator